LLLRYFGEQCEPCGNCDTCLTPAETFDATEPVRKLLSCVYRTGQRFGSRHVLDVLLGDETERVLAEGHDKLSTFGIGKDLDIKAWRYLVRQSMSKGLLVTAPGTQWVVRLGPDCGPVLRGEQTVHFRKPAPRAERKSRRGLRVGPGRVLGSDLPRSGSSGIVGSGDIGRIDAPVITAEENALFEALRRYRKELATAQGLPPYVIFHDTTLLAMAREKPGTMDKLGELPGIGAAKLARYGKDFLAVIAKHLTEA
jgi:ATP-dependent DNA helicase RecQ